MSNLSDNEKRYFEKLLGMGCGYVLDYSDATFGEFFTSHGVDIHGQKYQIYGTSKAKKLRAFWEQDSDIVVGNVLSEMLDSYKTNCDLNSQTFDKTGYNAAKNIVARLSGKPTNEITGNETDNFLHRKFIIPNIQSLPIKAEVVPIIEKRLEEAQKALGAKAYLSVIFLCGSILEGVLLGYAQKNPANLNQTSTSPKGNNGKVKPFQDWSLAQFIDSACEIGLLKPDIKAFSHGLRDFRNYIHPYQQLLSGFIPDEYTAKVCLQVLNAALASVAGERK